MKHFSFYDIIRRPALRIIQGDEIATQLYRWWHLDYDAMNDEDLDATINAFKYATKNLRRARWRRRQITERIKAR